MGELIFVAAISALLSGVVVTMILAPRTLKMGFKWAQAEVELAKAQELIDELRDEDPCFYDHHGYCQAHSLHSRPCPHERANALFAETGGDDG